MAVNPVWHGQQNATFPNLETDTMTIDTALTGGAIGTGSFVVTAAAVTTITDAAVTANTRIVWAPSNAAAGLLLRGKTCYTTTGSGSFTFNVSSTGSGAPAGTELFNYIVLAES